MMHVADLVRLLKFLRPHVGGLALSVLAGLATIAAGVGLMATSAYLISAAALQPSIATLQVAIVGVRFFGISRGVFRYLERLASHSLNFKLLADLRVWFYRAVEPLAPAGLQDEHSGDLLAQAITDIESLQDFYVRAVAPPVVAVLSCAGIAVFLGSFDPLLAAILLFFLLAVGVGLPIISRLLSRGPAQRMVTARSQLNTSLVDGIQGLPDLLAFGTVAAQAGRVRRLGEEYAQAQTSMARVSALQNGLGTLVVNLGGWAVLWAAIPLVQTGQIQGVHLAVLALASLASFEAVQPLPQAAQHLEVSRQAARRLFKTAGHPPPVTTAAEPSVLPAIPADISIHNMKFGYTNDAGPALDGISLTLPAGHRLALVGPSGSGKSTLSALLLRHWDGYNGEIRINGQDLYRFDPQDLARWIACVPQNPYFFTATIRQNLRMAFPAASELDMEQACRAAQIHDWILSLPEGYDTWVGEHALRLSGGERQRLAIARALLQDSPVLILDEPTTHLDAETGRRLFASLEAVTQGKTVLWITHQLVGLEVLDEVIVLQRGKIVERGRHAELLELGGLYWRMANEEDFAIQNGR